MGLLKASGTVLARSRVGEGGLWLTLFLKGQGIVRASAPGAEAGSVRFGGGTEPLVWGTFHLHQGRTFYLTAVDVVDDMLPLRRRPKALLEAVRWSKLLTRWLPAGSSDGGDPDDPLLANLYWNLRLLCVPQVPAEAAGWRFLWRWLTEWGLAPDLTCCGCCGRALEESVWTGEGLACPRCGGGEERPAFTAEGLRLLRQTAASSVKDLERAFQETPQFREGPFALASRCAEGLLRTAQ